MKEYSFNAVIQKQPHINAAFIEFPFDVEKEFGKKGQVKVIARFDTISYRGSLAKMGHHCHVLGLTREIRKSLGKEPGESIHVVIKEDTEPRVIELPSDFQKALEQVPEAIAVFDKLSYTHKKEYARWITGAKKQETRDSRIVKAIEMLSKGTKTPL